MQKDNIYKGQIFHWLTVISKPFHDIIPKQNGKQQKKWKVECRCRCGKIVKPLIGSLLRESTKSCGCYNLSIRSDVAKKRNQKYPKNLIRHRLYQSWKSMKNRCYNKKAPSYLGSDIQVYDEWKDDYKSFYDWAIDKWKPGLSLSRIDRTKGFCPSNCEFVSPKFIVKRNINSQKAKQTCLEKYGVDSPLKDLAIQHKAKLTNRKKYGCDYPQQSLKIKEKIKTTNQKKYGGNSCMSSIKVREKQKDTMIKRYGAPYTAQVPSIRAKQIATHLKNHGTIVPKSVRKSKHQISITNWVNKVSNLIFQSDCSVLKRKEIDLFNSEINLGIEYCGLYWHLEKTSNKNRMYHFNKYNDCLDKGIRLITMFSDEWLYRRYQVQNFLMSVLNCCDTKLYARKCDIEILDKNIGSQFIEDYHIQGKKPSWFYIGLIYDDEVVGVMSLSKHHRGLRQITIDRLCFKSGVLVVGGVSKLLKFAKGFAKENGYDKIVTWSDNRWSQGNAYQKCGFTLDAMLPPDYCYVNLASPKRRFSKQSMTKKKMNCPPNILEKDWAWQLGYDRIWDCGKKRWVVDV